MMSEFAKQVFTACPTLMHLQLVDSDDIGICFSVCPRTTKTPSVVGIEALDFSERIVMECWKRFDGKTWRTYSP